MGDTVIRSVAKALVLLEGLTARPGTPVGVAELARRTGLAKSTTYRLLAVLCQFRLVERWSGKYVLSHRLAELGEFACARPPRLLRVGLQPWLQELHRMTGAVARATVLCGRHEVCIAMACDHDSQELALALPDHSPAGRTAGGIAILAHSPADLCDHAFERFHPRSIVELYQQLENVRRTGWASSRDIIRQDVWTISAPVFDNQHGPVAAFAVTGRFGPGAPAEIGSVVATMADLATKDMNHTNPRDEP